MPIYDHPTMLSAQDLVIFHAALSDLQGNLLKSHGRHHAAHLFLTFQPGKQKNARQFLAAMSLHVTSAEAQIEQTKHFKAGGTEVVFEQCMLSSDGYRYLGIAVDDFDSSFQKGMKDSAINRNLSDPSVADWQLEYQRQLHAMIIIAHSDSGALMQRVEQIEGALAGIALVYNEMGDAVFRVNDPNNEPIEHFGYLDGRSQPIFFQDDWIKNERSTANWDPQAKPGLILTQDLRAASPESAGSYFVFRKLEQNVQGFKKREQALAKALGLVGDARELAGAMVVGRFENGTPVITHDVADPEVAPPENDFNALMDPDGNKCPFAAHIRKVNPRGVNARAEDLAGEKSHRIARRGITFGDTTPPGDDLDRLPTDGVGLLFQCCNGVLGTQFELMQQCWANDPNFPKSDIGIDPVIGQHQGQTTVQKWPNPYDSPNWLTFSFQDFVTMKGGEYFFVPSISFLKNLVD